VKGKGKLLAAEVELWTSFLKLIWCPTHTIGLHLWEKHQIHLYMIKWSKKIIHPS